MMKKETGLPCSTNFVFDKQINSLEEFEKVIKKDVSLFYNHSVYPTAFVIHQSYSVLRYQIEHGNIWTIKRK